MVQWLECLTSESVILGSNPIQSCFLFELNLMLLLMRSLLLEHYLDLKPVKSHV